MTRGGYRPSVTSYAEDSGNTEPSDDNEPAHDDLPDELEGELVPDPPSTATEDPDTETLTGRADDADGPGSSPGVG
jgi:hypothetical protein